MSDDSDAASIITGGVGYNIGSPSVLLLARNSFDSFADDVSPARAANYYSPLGPNSIFELIASIENKRKNKVSISVNKKSFKVPLGPPTTQDIPQIKLTKLEKINGDRVSRYLHEVENDYGVFASHQSLTHSSVNKLSQQEPSLGSVPMIYFSKEFHLDEPRVFYEVTEGHEITEGEDSGVINEIQEQLSLYLDIVELSLIEEISKSSNSFFDTFNELSRILETCRKSAGVAGELKGMLGTLKRNQVDVGLRLVANVQKQANILRLQQSMMQMNMVLKIADYAEILFYKSDSIGLLNLVNFAEHLIRGELYQLPADDIVASQKDLIGKIVARVEQNAAVASDILYDLSSIKSLVHLVGLFANLKNKIGQNFNNLFIDFIIEDLKSFYSSIGIKNSFQKLLNYSKPNSSTTIRYGEFDENFKVVQCQYLYGLIKCNEIFNTFKNLQEKLVIEFKNIIKNHLPNEDNYTSLESFSGAESTDSQVKLNKNSFTLSTVFSESKSPSSVTSNFNNNTSTANQKLISYLRSMTPKEFEIMLINIYCNLSEALTRFSSFQKLLLDLSLNYIEYLPSAVSDDEVILKLDLSSLITRLIEIIQKRLYKILAIRNDLINHLNYKFFTRFYLINKLFIIDNENLSIGSVNNYYLAKYLTKQLNEFYVVYTNSLKKNVLETIEKEIWKDLNNMPNGKALNLQGQTLINEIIESKDGFPSTWQQIVDFQDYFSEIPSVESTPNEDTKRLTINSSKIVVPSLMVSLLQYIKELIFLHSRLGKNISKFPFVLIDLIRLSNTKIKHQILGANATKTAGLKHITAKHLSISSQSLECLIQLLPIVKLSITYINQTVLKKPEFKRSLEIFDGSDSSSLTVEQEFDNLNDLLKDHQNEIFTKLISIMNDRLNNHITELKQLNMALPLTGQCHKYMEVLCKETVTIANVLIKYLSPNQYLLVLSEIFGNFKKIFLLEFEKFSFKDNFEKMNLMKDIDYYRVKLGDIPGYGESGTILWEVVNRNKTKEDVEMEKKMFGAPKEIQAEAEVKEVNDKIQADTKKKNVEETEAEIDTREKNIEHTEDLKQEAESVPQVKVTSVEQGLEDEVNEQLKQKSKDGVFNINTPNYSTNDLAKDETDFDSEADITFVKDEESVKLNNQFEKEEIENQSIGNFDFKGQNVLEQVKETALETGEKGVKNLETEQKVEKPETKQKVEKLEKEQGVENLETEQEVENLETEQEVEKPETEQKVEKPETEQEVENLEKAQAVEKLEKSEQQFKQEVEQEGGTKAIENGNVENENVKTGKAENENDNAGTEEVENDKDQESDLKTKSEREDTPGNIDEVKIEKTNDALVELNNPETPETSKLESPNLETENINDAKVEFSKPAEAQQTTELLNKVSESIDSALTIDPINLEQIQENSPIQNKTDAETDSSKNVSSTKAKKKKKKNKKKK